MSYSIGNCTPHFALEGCDWRRMNVMRRLFSSLALILVFAFIGLFVYRFYSKHDRSNATPDCPERDAKNIHRAPKEASGTYNLRSYGIWTVGESRTCLFAKNVDDAPCFTTEQGRNGTQEPQHEYLVVVTFDRPIPFGDSGVYGVRCHLESNSQAWCHIE